MDPLSVAGSIVGILTAAAKVVEIVEVFVSSTKDAPKIARSVYSEVDRVLILLNSLKAFLDDLSISSKRAAYIQVEHLQIVFTDGVLIFSELDSIVGPLMTPDQTPLQFAKKLQWATKKRAISDVLDRLRGFQISLSPMLNIFQCGSELEAAKSQRELEAQISRVLESNEAVARRVKELEYASSTHRKDRQHKGPSHTLVEEKDDATITSTHTRVAIPDVEGRSRDRRTLIDHPALRRFSTSSLIHFETALRYSTVYRRVQRPESLFSFSSSAIDSRAWSYFSGLSLAQISKISVIALPLCQKDIRNPHHYSFGEIPKERIPEAEPISAVQGDGRLFFCTFCEDLNSFATEADWREHELLVHETGEDWPCTKERCHKVLDSRREFEDHFLSDHDEPPNGYYHVELGWRPLPFTPEGVRTRLLPKRVFGCGFDSCERYIFGWDKRCNHVADHMKQGQPYNQWKYSTIIHNLLRQDATRDIWKGLHMQSQSRWEPDNYTRILKQKLECGDFRPGRKEVCMAAWWLRSDLDFPTQPAGSQYIFIQGSFLPPSQDSVPLSFTSLPIEKQMLILNPLPHGLHLKDRQEIMRQTQF